MLQKRPTLVGETRLSHPTHLRNCPEEKKDQEQSDLWGPRKDHSCGPYIERQDFRKVAKSWDDGREKKRTIVGDEGNIEGEGR